MTQQTQLRPYGVPGSLYGSFSGKTAAPSVGPPEWSWDLEAYISSVWTPFTEDILTHKSPIVASRGISGAGITNRVAAIGNLTTTLDNGKSNSAGLLGYYSPQHANMRANFGRDTKVRLKFTFNSNEYVKWKGYISDLDPTPGEFKERESYLSAVDYMKKLAKQRLKLLSVQQDQRSDEILQTVINSLSAQPDNIDFETDNFTLPFSLSSELDEKTTAMGFIQKLCQTVLAYCYLGDDETLVFQREETRVTQASAGTLNNTMSKLVTGRPNDDDIINKLIGKVHPTRVDEEPTTLIYENDNEIVILGGDTQVFTFQYKDPQNQASRISALDVNNNSPLEANTHYRASHFQRTTKDDANSDLSITDTNGSNSSEWEVENTSGSSVYLNLINLFGKGIYYFNPVTVTEETGDADREATYEFYYLDDVIRARGYLTHLLNRASSDVPVIESVSFLASANETLMGYAMTWDIGTRITPIETVTGLNRDYTINHVTYTLQPDGELLVEYALEPADTVSYFILDQSLLDGPDVLSPF